MKLKNIIVYTLICLCFITCQDKSKEKELEDKEKELLIRENELLKKELGKSDSLEISKTGNLKAFKVDKALVKKLFLKSLNDFSDGRTLSTCNIMIGDLNGDNLLDAVVDYGFAPTSEDNGGGGNAVSEISGLIAFINNGENLKIVDNSEDFGGNFGARNDLKKISNGVIILQGLEYSEEDARCCPSIKTTTKIILRNNKLTKI
jgi:hypothetical protein